MKGTYILQQELDSMLFSVWEIGKQQGHSRFVGDASETAQYLRNTDQENLEVSALDKKFMHSLAPIPARNWLIWYYQTASRLLEDEKVDEKDLVHYPVRT